MLLVVNFSFTRVFLKDVEVSISDRRVLVKYAKWLTKTKVLLDGFGFIDEVSGVVFPKVRQHARVGDA